MKNIIDHYMASGSGTGYKEAVASFMEFMHQGSLGISSPKIPPQVLLAAFAYEYEEGNTGLERLLRLCSESEPTDPMEITVPIDPYQIVSMIPVFAADDVNFKKTGIMGGVSIHTLGFGQDSVTKVRFLVNSEESEQKKKLILSHMMGHYFLNHYSIPGKVRTKYLENSFSVDVDRTLELREYEANSFALDLLIPRNVLGMVMDEGTCTIPEMLEIFDVPAEAIKAQAIRIGRRLPVFGMVEFKNDLEYLDINI